MAAIIVLTIHAGDDNRVIIGPFKDGNEASRYGFDTFKDNRTAQGDSVTWCWQDLVEPQSPYAVQLGATPSR